MPDQRNTPRGDWLAHKLDLFLPALYDSVHPDGRAAMLDQAICSRNHYCAAVDRGDYAAAIDQVARHYRLDVVRLWWESFNPRPFDALTLREVLTFAYDTSEAPSAHPYTKLVALFRAAGFMAITRQGEVRLRVDRVSTDPLVVHRGVSSAPFAQRAVRRQAWKNLSWTARPEVARWFALRYGSGGIVYTATIPPEGVLAVFEDDERAVIVDPRLLREVHAEEVEGEPFHPPGATGLGHVVG